MHFHMWCTFIDERSDDSASTGLLWGSLDQIAAEIINLCELVVSGFTDGLSIKQVSKLLAAGELDYEEEDCSFEQYYKLKACKSITKDELSFFSFGIVDWTEDTWEVVDTYDKLAEEFSEYSKDKEILSRWEMTPNIDDDTVDWAKINDELRLLSDYGFDLSRRFTYFRVKRQ